MIVAVYQAFNSYPPNSLHRDPHPAHVSKSTYHLAALSMLVLAHKLLLGHLMAQCIPTSHRHARSPTCSHEESAQVSDVCM